MRIDASGHENQLFAQLGKFRVDIPTFGLMVALALINAAYILQADFLRRGIQADAFTMITFVGTNSNTRWICEKNMQGPPFMEVIIHAPFGPARFRMSKDFEAL